MSYRPEIDGLRAVAVLLVLLFHARIAGFSGGFVGVDVFFVISGFLIASIIRSDIARGTLSLLGFYERRVRRILPALVVVMAGTLALGALFLLPEELKETSASAVPQVPSWPTSISRRASIILKMKAGRRPCCICGRFPSKSSSTSWRRSHC